MPPGDCVVRLLAYTSVDVKTRTSALLEAQRVVSRAQLPALNCRPQLPTPRTSQRSRPHITGSNCHQEAVHIVHVALRALLVLAKRTKLPSHEETPCWKAQAGALKLEGNLQGPRSLLAATCSSTEFITPFAPVVLTRLLPALCMLTLSKQLCSSTWYSSSVQICTSRGPGTGTASLPAILIATLLLVQDLGFKACGRSRMLRLGFLRLLHSNYNSYPYRQGETEQRRRPHSSGRCPAPECAKLEPMQGCSGTLIGARDRLETKSLSPKKRISKYRQQNAYESPNEVQEKHLMCEVCVHACWNPVPLPCLPCLPSLLPFLSGEFLGSSPGHHGSGDFLSVPLPFSCSFLGLIFAPRTYGGGRISPSPSRNRRESQRGTDRHQERERGTTNKNRRAVKSTCPPDRQRAHHPPWCIPLGARRKALRLGLLIHT